MTRTILLYTIVCVLAFSSGCKKNRQQNYSRANIATNSEITNGNMSDSDQCDNKTPSNNVYDTTVYDTNGISGFVNLTDIVPDAILEIRYFSTFNFVGSRIDGYLQPTALLTREAADSLQAVSEELKSQGYRLKIFDAYRPQMAVNHFVRWGKDLKDTLMRQYFYPHIDKSKLFILGYIASHSGHSRGSTVDLTLFDMNSEKEVDMGGTFDWFGQESHPDCGGSLKTFKYRSNDTLTSEQFNNRMILRKAMVKHGFRPYDNEWWHFTLRNEPYPNTYFKFPVREL